MSYNLMRLFSDEMKKLFPDTEPLMEIDESHWYESPRWAAPCMCGHQEHGYSGQCTHMCCTESDDCECGGFEPQPGMWMPPVRHEGLHPFLKMLRGGSLR